MISTVPPQPIIFILEPFGGSARRHNPALPHVYFDDAAVTRGDGVFETLLVRGGAAANLERHTRRFADSAAQLGLPAPQLGQWQEVTAEAAQAWEEQHGERFPEAQCTWTYTRGRESSGLPSAWLTVRPVPQKYAKQRRKGVRVMTGSRGFRVESGKNAAPWLTLGAKTLNYAANMAALRYAAAQGFDDVIFTDPDSGRVLEAATSTVVVVKKGGRLRTPAPGGDILPGTSQQAIFEYAGRRGYKCKARDLDLGDLLRAESVWLVSSVRRAVRITAIDGTELAGPANAGELGELFDAALSL